MYASAHQLSSPTFNVTCMSYVKQELHSLFGQFILEEMSYQKKNIFRSDISCLQCVVLAVHPRPETSCAIKVSHLARALGDNVRIVKSAPIDLPGAVDPQARSARFVDMGRVPVHENVAVEVPADLSQDIVVESPLSLVILVTVEEDKNLTVRYVGLVVEVEQVLQLGVQVRGVAV